MSTESKLLERAWGIIANANGGNWDKASGIWRKAATDWRNAYFRWYQDHPEVHPVEGEAKP